MNITRLVTKGLTLVLCLQVLVPASVAGAATIGLDDPLAVSAEGEYRADLRKDPAARFASSAFTDAVSRDLAGTGLVVSGGNSLPIAGFADGDIIAGFNTWSVGHTGIMDATRGIALTSACIWSAVKEAPTCVTLERPNKYRGYEWAAGLWVPGALASQRTSARRFCSSQTGERYNIASSKSDYTQWYCSKLPWAGYTDRAAKDLDANGGYWVTPADLYNDNDTRVFAYSN